MKFETIQEIYLNNEGIRGNLQRLVRNLSDEQINFRIDENAWTIKEIVEHMAITEAGMSSISASLLKKSTAENLPNDGSAHISQEFLQKVALLGDRKTRKVSAPERVNPLGQLSIDESFAKMEENSKVLAEIKVGLEKIDTQSLKFPHPFFGDLSATEWLLVLGGHEARHVDQIEEILSKFQ